MTAKGGEALKQEKKREVGSILSRLKARYGEDGVLSRDTVVLCGQRSVTLYNCQRILFYSPCEIRLLVAKRALSITGERLYCSSFTGGTVTVEGKIVGVTYVIEPAGSAH